MFNGQSVSVVLMTYAERDSIRAVIESFSRSGVVDEILVINNNAQPGTSDEVAHTGAKEIIEPRQGYGWASRRGLTEAQGDLVVLCEPDGTFDGSDIGKLLAYSADCDAVFGSRTHRSLIWEGANMGAFLRIGNWAVAKYLRLIFRTQHLSDVGCTYRLLRRETVAKVLPELQIGGSQLGPELMIRTLLSGARVVEVPVNYRPRVGVSAVTGEFHKALVLGVQMIALITAMRVRSLGKGRRPETLTASVDIASASAVLDAAVSGHSVVDLLPEGEVEVEVEVEGVPLLVTVPAHTTSQVGRVYQRSSYTG